MDHSRRYNPHQRPSSAPIFFPKEVRLIGEEGESLGIVSFRQAQDISREKNLDLIVVSANAEPPVCRLGDSGRFDYEQKKRQKEQKKKQKMVLLKEVQLRVNIENHDYQFKLGKAVEFLKDRDKVKITLQFRGREVAFADLGRKTIERFIRDLEAVGKVESMPRLEGRRMVAIIAPLAPKEGAGDVSPSKVESGSQGMSSSRVQGASGKIQEPGAAKADGAAMDVSTSKTIIQSKVLAPDTDATLSSDADLKN